MAASQALRRLLRLRRLEEEQHHAALEAALLEQQRLENALANTRMRESAGRQQIAHSAGAIEDRIAGLVEVEGGRRASAVLSRRVAEARQRAGQLRRFYLAKRVERRQAETVLREAQALADAEQARRVQQGLDDWFGRRQHAATRSPEPLRQTSEKPEMKKGEESRVVPEEELRTNP